MVVSAVVAPPRAMELQVTDKLETMPQELPYFYNVQSYKPGETVIYAAARRHPAAKVADLWYQVRKKIGDIRSSLPQGCWGQTSTTNTATPTA
jgi:multidrug efflux pump